LAFRPTQTTVLTLSCRAKRREVNQSIQLTIIIALNKAVEARVTVVHTSQYINN